MLDWVVRVLSLAASSVIIGGMLSVSAGGFGWKTLFSYHPVFMSIGFLLFLSNGIVAYISDYGPAHKYAPDRAARRVVHGAFQLIGTIFVIVGYLVAFAVHQTGGKSQFGRHEAAGNASRTWHVWFGYVTIVFMLGQSILGMYKYVLKARSPPVNVAKWHGKFGVVVYSLGIASVIIAIKAVWIQNKHLAVGVTALVLVVILYAAVILLTFCGPSKAVDQSQPALTPLTAAEDSMRGGGRRDVINR